MVTYQGLQTAITEAYGDEIWRAVKAGLGVVCSMAFKGRTHPLALIYEGPSGTGKSTCINMFDPDRESTAKLLYRLDGFTPKAFVSQAANISKEEIAGIDLLPKLKDKVLLTKELAPIFRGTENDLRERFATLTAVLDGKGLLLASGVHGTRGYGDKHIFNWLGGSTPIPSKTDAVMAQLGNRLLRYEFWGAEPTDEELVAYLEGSSRESREKECRTLVNAYLARVFEESPVSTIGEETVTIEGAMKLEIARLARLIGHGRVELNSVETPEQGEPEFVGGSPEGPHRVVLLLKQLAQGLSLAAGRRSVDWHDMDVVRHVAYSSIPGERRRVLRVLAEEGRTATSTRLERRLGIARPTARRYMRQLAATGIALFKAGSGNEPDEITLAREWEWVHANEAVLIGKEGSQEEKRAA